MDLQRDHGKARSGYVALSAMRSERRSRELSFHQIAEGTAKI